MGTLDRRGASYPLRVYCRSMSLIKRIDLDKVGMCASAICAVHCLLTGLAFGLLSISGLAFIDNEAWDITFIVAAAVLGAFAVVHGQRKHHSLFPGLVFLVGMTSVVIGNFFMKHVHRDGVPESFFTHWGHTFFMVVGGLSLVSFHMLNVWLQRHGGCGCEGCATVQRKAAVGHNLEEGSRPAEPFARIS